MAHLHLNELSLICDMWLNKITYLLTYLLTSSENSSGCSTAAEDYIQRTPVHYVKDNLVKIF